MASYVEPRRAIGEEILVRSGWGDGGRKGGNGVAWGSVRPSRIMSTC